MRVCGVSTWTKIRVPVAGLFEQFLLFPTHKQNGGDFCLSMGVGRTETFFDLAVAWPRRDSSGVLHRAWGVDLVCLFSLAEVKFNVTGVSYVFTCF